KLCPISADHIEPRRKKRNRAGYCGREWKLSHCIAARRLCLGCARTRTRSCSRETTTIHGCFEPDCARRYRYRHGCPLDLVLYTALLQLLFCVQEISQRSLRIWPTS